MTRVVFTRMPDGALATVDIQGHAGYAEEGEDIVCSAITSAVQLTHILLDDIRGLVFRTTVEQEGAHIRIELPVGAREGAKDAMEALFVHYNEMQENYADFITGLEVYSDAEN